MQHELRGWPPSSCSLSRSSSFLGCHGRFCRVAHRAQKVEVWDDLGWVIAKGEVTPREAAAALDSALLSFSAAGAAAAVAKQEQDVPAPLHHLITCTLKSARGTAGPGEGRATFRIRIVRPEEVAPPGRHRSEEENGTARRGSAAVARYGALDGINDLLGFSPRSSSGSGSSVARSSSGSGGLSSALGGGLLGDLAAPTTAADHPLDESWSSAEQQREAGPAEGAEKKESDPAAAVQGELPVSPAGNTAGAAGVETEAVGNNAHGPTTYGGGGEATPLLSGASVVVRPGEPEAAVSGESEATGEGLAGAHRSSAGCLTSSPVHRDHGAVQFPVPDGSVADAGYSDDDFDDEDDAGSGEAARASAATQRLFSFSSASSASGFENDSDEDDGGGGRGGDNEGNPDRDEGRRGRQQKRDEMVVSSAAVRLRRRLLRAAATCGDGNGGKDAAAALFDRIDQVCMERNRKSSRPTSFPTNDG